MTLRRGRRARRHRLAWASIPGASISACSGVAIRLLGNPRHYRDPHTEGIMEAAFARVSRPEIFRQTGLQFMRFNTLFQLLALQRDRSPLLDVAEDAAR